MNEKLQDLPHVLMRTGGEQPASRLHHVTRPDEVVAALVLVALTGAPGDGEASDEGPGFFL
jgi:hypothetical protein